MKRICIPENTICFQDNTKKVTKQGQIAECLDVQISHLGKCKLRKHICMFFLQIVIEKTYLYVFANCNWENMYMFFASYSWEKILVSQKRKIKARARTPSKIV